LNKKIRPLKISDIANIEQVYINSFNKKKDKIRKPTIWEMYIKKSHDFSLGIFENNKLIGFSIAHFLDNLVWFGPIGIMKNYQSQGIGSYLLNHQIKKIRQHNKDYNLFLESPELIKNVKFYYKNNFLLHDIVFKILINLKKTHIPKDKKYKTKVLNHSDISKIINSFQINFSNEFLAFIEYHVGIILQIYNNDNQAIALIQTHSPYIKEDNYVTLKYLFYKHFDIKILYKIFNFLKIINKNLVYFSVGGNKYNILDFLGNENYKILHYNLLMKHTSNNKTYNNIDFFSMSG